MLSTRYGIGVCEEKERWDRKEKEYLQIPCPVTVSKYNVCMGGVDFCDQMVAE